MRTVIIGAGEVGYTIAKKLVDEGKDVAVVEGDPQRLRLSNATLDAIVVDGSGSNPASIAAGIADAAMVVAVTSSDEINITACLVCSVLAPKAIRLARIRNPHLSAMQELFDERHLALDLAIHPEGLAAEKTLALLRHPGAVDYVSFAGGRVNVLGVPIPAQSALAGRTLAELGHESWAHKVLVAAVERDRQLIVPRGEHRVIAGDMLYVVTTPESVAEVMALIGHAQTPVKHAMVFGGSPMGASIAAGLITQGVSVKMIEPDADRCNRLAEQLPTAVVLQGDGTDEALLRSENIAGMEAFVSCATDDEEANIMAALLAKRLGARSTVVVTNKSSLVTLLPSFGIDVAVSPRSLAVGSILQFIRRGRVVSVMPFSDDAAEAIEFLAPEHASVTSKPLKDLAFPSEALITAIVRDDQVIVPSGDTCVEVNDRVIVFALRSAIEAVERFFRPRR